MDARRRAALEEAHLHLLQADLQLKRAIARGEVAPTPVVRAAQDTIRAAAQKFSALLAETDAPPAQVIPFPPRGAR